MFRCCRAGGGGCQRGEGGRGGGIGEGELGGELGGGIGIGGGRYLRAQGSGLAGALRRWSLGLKVLGSKAGRWECEGVDMI